jgi:hypothetical protein
VTVLLVPGFNKKDGAQFICRVFRRWGCRHVLRNRLSLTDGRRNMLRDRVSRVDGLSSSGEQLRCRAGQDFVLVRTIIARLDARLCWCVRIALPMQASRRMAMFARPAIP